MAYCYVSLFPDCEDYGEIILCITFFSSFIIIFYFTYGLYMERYILDSELSGIMDAFSKPLFLLNSESKQYLKEIVDSIKLPDASDADREVNENNKKLIK